MKFIFIVLSGCMLLSGCASKALMVYSIPAGAEVYRHSDYARNLLGTTPLTSSVEAMMPDWKGDGGDTGITLLFKKPGYQDLKLHVREFELSSEINVTLKPEKGKNR